MKFILIIQGPILSIGRSGKTNSETEFKADSIIEFDTTENINKLVNKFGNLFEEIILSTWQSENTSLINKHEKLNIIKNIEPISPIIGKFDNHVILNNKYKQIIGLKLGIESITIKESNDIYLIKIRTDQYIDLENLIDWITINYNIINDKICVPHFRLSQLNNVVSPYIADFYWGGKKEKILTLCDSLLAYNNFEFESIIHYDIFFKYALKKLKSIEKILLFTNSTKFTFQLYNYFQKIIFEEFYSFPFEIYYNLKWRGENWNFSNLEVIENNNYYCFELTEKNKNKEIILPKINVFNKFYFIDYIKYLNWKNNRINFLLLFFIKIGRRFAYIYYKTRYNRSNLFGYHIKKK